MSIKSSSAPSWLGRGKKAGSGEPVEINAEKELTPYVAFITKTDSDNIDGNNPAKSGYNIDQFTWEEDTENGGYKRSIPFTTHQKGYIWRTLSSGDNQLEFPVDGQELSDEAPTNLIIPRVKTYSQVENGDYEETYDSAKININDGTVTVYSNINDPAYLVVIY